MARIVANGLTHFYRSEGDPESPAVVLAHPIGSDHGVWDSVAPVLAKRYFVVRYDLRGHGGTEVPAGPYTLEMLAADAAALTKALSLKRFAFCGISLGALIGLHLASVGHPGIAAIVAANASLKLPLSGEQWDERINATLLTGMKPLSAGMVERMFSATYRDSNRTSVETMTNAFLNTDPEGYASSLSVLKEADLREAVKRVTTPVLVICGEDDAAVPSADMRLMADEISGSTLRVLPGGHFSALEQPALYADCVIDFLSKNTH